MGMMMFSCDQSTDLALVATSARWKLLVATSAIWKLVGVLYNKSLWFDLIVLFLYMFESLFRHFIFHFLRSISNKLFSQPTTSDLHMSPVPVFEALKRIEDTRSKEANQTFFA
jgi:hypothetical protein